MLITVGPSLSMLTRQHLADQSMRLLTSAMKQSHGAVMITDALGRIEYVNPRYTEITGISHDALLGTLSKLPVNKLKVDRSIIHNLPANAHDCAITTAVIALAQKLGLKVVAEGVENAAQRDFLLLHNCSFQQGYEFGVPVAFAELPGSIARLQGHLNRPATGAPTRH